MKRIIAAVLCLCLLILPAQAQLPEVPAKSALLMEGATGRVLYEQNAHEPLAPASVTKIMTLLLIMEALDSGQITWESPVTASETAAAKGGSQVFLKVGETMSVRDMVKSIAVSSANDCACAMAEHLAGSEQAFVERMNRRAGELGMKDTHFINCTGLDDAPEAKDHLTSAWDIAIMSRQLLMNHPEIEKYTTIWMDTIRNGRFGLSNTNKMVRFYRGCTGLKTGYTSGAGYCLSATARREDMNLIAVVMGCKTPQERMGACRSLLDGGFASYSLISPDLPQPVELPVSLGVQDRVQAELAERRSLVIDKNQKNQITQELSLREELQAPVARGQQVGVLTVKAGDKILWEIPVVTREAVEKLTWWQLFTQILSNSFPKSEGPAPAESSPSSQGKV